MSSKEHHSKRRAGVFTPTSLSLCLSISFGLQSKQGRRLTFLHLPQDNLKFSIDSGKSFTYSSPVPILTLPLTLQLPCLSISLVHLWPPQAPIDAVTKVFLTSSHTNYGGFWTGVTVAQEGWEIEVVAVGESRLVVVWLSFTQDIDSMSGSAAKNIWSHPQTYNCLFCPKPWSPDFIPSARWFHITCLKESMLKKINEACTQQNEQTTFLLCQVPQLLTS